VGNYDAIQQPLVIDNGFDYICFVRKGLKETNYIGKWRIEEIPIELDDDIRLSRYPKILPHRTCLVYYDYSLYVDANIIISGDYVYNRIRELAKSKTTLALINHPARDCVYLEALSCMIACKASWTSLIIQMLYMKLRRVPSHNGLYEANVIFRNHNDEHIKLIDELWWDTYMRFSKRDQLSLAYSLYVRGWNKCFFLPLGKSTSNHDSFIRNAHLPRKDSSSLYLKKKIGISFVILWKIVFHRK